MVVFQFVGELLTGDFVAGQQLPYKPRDIKKLKCTHELGDTLERHIMVNCKNS